MAEEPTPSTGASHLKCKELFFFPDNRASAAVLALTKLCRSSDSNNDKHTNHWANIPLVSFNPCMKVITDKSVLIRNFLALRTCSNFLIPWITAWEENGTGWNG